jgi:hypothetical protein
VINEYCAKLAHYLQFGIHGNRSTFADSVWE